MANRTEGSLEFPFTGKEALPETVDWRTKHIVTPVKNQVRYQQCDITPRVMISRRRECLMLNRAV